MLLYSVKIVSAPSGQFTKKKSNYRNVINGRFFEIYATG